MVGRQEAPERRSGSFDAFDLVRRGGTIAGKVDASKMPRLADRLSPEGGVTQVAWRITGRLTPLGRQALEIRLDGTVALACQRCLQGFSSPVAQCTLLLLARNEHELAMLDDDDEHEVVLADAPLDAATLIEDEMLLTLPLVARCGRDDCEGSPVSEGDPAAARPSAFAALAPLQGAATKKSKT